MGAAATIPDERILPLVRPKGSGCTWDIQEALTEYPRKVVLAKLKQLARRGVIDGCACGCRGDWTMQP